MHVVYERCAAIDVGKDEIAVAVRMPGDGRDGRLRSSGRSGRLRGDGRGRPVAGLARGDALAMEATGIYSMPVYYALLEHGNFEKVLICNAAHVKNVPGRKTDYADAEWLAHLLECGMLAGSFIPPAEIKAARDVVRYRTKIVQQRVSEIARLGNTLQDALFSELKMVSWVSGSGRFPEACSTAAITRLMLRLSRPVRVSRRSTGIPSARLAASRSIRCCRRRSRAGHRYPGR